MIFKKTRANPDQSALNGSISQLPRMPADVYQRNGIAYRPPRPRPAAAPAPAVVATAIATAHVHGNGNRAPPTTSNNASISHRSRPRPPLRSTNPSSRPPVITDAPAAVAPGPAVVTPHVHSNGNVAPSTTPNNDVAPPATSNNVSTPLLSGPRRRLHSMNPFSRPNGPFNRINKNHNTRKRASHTLRVYIQVDNQWQPGQQIRVLTPNKNIAIVTIPPRSKWLTETENTNNNGISGPFFRIEFTPTSQTLNQLGNQQNTSSCTCVPSLGVFDSTCPRHGNLAQGEDGGGSVVSIAREEGGGIITPFQTPVPTPVTRRGLGWECKSCITINVAQNEVCKLCGVRKHGEVREHDMQPATLHLA